MLLQSLLEERMEFFRSFYICCALIYVLLCCILDVFAIDPSFDVPVFNVTVVAGQTAVLPCTVENLQGHKVVWTDRFSTLLTYDIGRIIDDDRIGVERPFTDDWNLLIHSVKYSDAGKYVCQINTKPVKTKTVMLHVLVPPIINDEMSSSDVIAKEGDTITLTCNVSGIPPPTVHWYRRPLDQGLGKAKERLVPMKQTYNPVPCTYTFHKTGVGMNGEFLIIHNISRYCDGIYECVVFNNVPPAVNKDIKVEVEFAPEIDLPNRRIGQEPGRETILECQITAFPMNYLVWKFKNEELKTSKKHRIEIYQDGNHRVTLSLRVMDITYSDYGNYSCVAKNMLGEDEDVMLLYDHRVKYTPTTTTTTTTYKPQIFRTTPHTIWENAGNKLIDGNDKATSAMKGGAVDSSYKHSISSVYICFNIIIVYIIS